MKVYFRKSALAGCLTLLLNAAGYADTVPAITPFNVWIQGNFTPNGAETNGGLAVGGTATLSSYDIAGSLLVENLTSFPSNTTFVAVNLSGETALEKGNYFIGNTGYTFYNHGSGTADSSDPVNFSSQAAQFAALSQSLGKLGTTGSDACTNSYGTVTCTDNVPNTLNVINVTAGALGNGLNITGVSATSPLLINVSGASATMEPWGITVDGSGSNGDSTTPNAGYVLFNFYNATSVVLGSGLVGSVLAPTAAVTTNASGQLDGQLIAKSFSASNGALEFHNFTYDGSLPSGSVPEPGEYGMVGIGLSAIVWLTGRRAGITHR
ncbi:MAG: choice-of-anchor A family protein [Acidobacteriia bacterium]|nr:choice-of-anchor A family protein [Terriglobia bacterium]MBV8903628.1 choice-of-anchor A family protein [Terriglobia bacterium]